jgi:hypothetical protein
MNDCHLNYIKKILQEDIVHNPLITWDIDFKESFATLLVFRVARIK